mmetsp:Transcript_3151/g.5740  ORF Transcript_3151/g.5740 Transcript_3151/m.5740 type:complete len:87 (-) Transcript_3151:228-488(-)
MSMLLPLRVFILVKVQHHSPHPGFNWIVSGPFKNHLTNHRTRYSETRKRKHRNHEQHTTLPTLSLDDPVAFARSPHVRFFSNIFIY